MVVGRLGTGKPSTFLNPVIANASDNANYRAAIIQHNFGPTKVALAYRRASAMNGAIPAIGGKVVERKSVMTSLSPKPMNAVIPADKIFKASMPFSAS